MVGAEFLSKMKPSMRLTAGVICIGYEKNRFTVYKPFRMYVTIPVGFSASRISV